MNRALCAAQTRAASVHLISSRLSSDVVGVYWWNPRRLLRRRERQTPSVGFSDAIRKIPSLCCSLSQTRPFGSEDVRQKHILREGGWRRQRRTLATGVTTEVMVMADMVCVRGTVVGVGCAGSLTVQIGPKLWKPPNVGCMLCYPMRSSRQLGILLYPVQA